MTKVDFIFYALGIFSYIAIEITHKERQLRFQKIDEINKKKERYSLQVKAIKEREALEEVRKEREERRKEGMAGMANAAQLLSEMSDQEVMRRSRITSGKF